MSKKISVRWRFIGVELLSDVAFILCAFICFGGLMLVLNADSIHVSAPNSFGTLRAEVITATGALIMFLSLFGMLFASAVRLLIEIDRHLALAGQPNQAPPSVTVQASPEASRASASAAHPNLPYVAGTYLRRMAASAREIYDRSSSRQRLIAGSAIAIVAVAMLLIHGWHTYSLANSCPINSSAAELVCGDSTLLHDDEVVRKLYADRLKATLYSGLRADIEAAQTTFIERRDACANAPAPKQCLMDEYSARMATLAEGM